jgi:RimJ/RimL family protein N-acetyltransferase
MSARTDFLPIKTERLIIRGWRDADREPHSAMCADPRVMAFLPGVLSRSECDARIDRYIATQMTHGFGFWALEERETGAFVGYTGIKPTNFDADFTPAVEFGWRLPFAYWGRGYASEAARACLDHGFGTLGLSEIVAITAKANLRSQAVMRRIGMSHDPQDDFLFPDLPPDHRLQPFVLYRIRASATSTKETHS